MWHHKHKINPRSTSMRTNIKINKIIDFLTNLWQEIRDGRSEVVSYRSELLRSVEKQTTTINKKLKQKINILKRKLQESDEKLAPLKQDKIKLQAALSAISLDSTEISAEDRSTIDQYIETNESIDEIEVNIAYYTEKKAYYTKYQEQLDKYKVDLQNIASQSNAMDFTQMIEDSTHALINNLNNPNLKQQMLTMLHDKSLTANSATIEINSKASIKRLEQDISYLSPFKYLPKIEESSKRAIDKENSRQESSVQTIQNLKTHTSNQYAQLKALDYKQKAKELTAPQNKQQTHNTKNKILKEIHNYFKSLLLKNKSKLILTRMQVHKMFEIHFNKYMQQTFKEIIEGELLPKRILRETPIRLVAKHNNPQILITKKLKKEIKTITSDIEIQQILPLPIQDLIKPNPKITTNENIVTEPLNEPTQDAQTSTNELTQETQVSTNELTQETQTSASNTEIQQIPLSPIQDLLKLNSKTITNENIVTEPLNELTQETQVSTNELTQETQASASNTKIQQIPLSPIQDLLKLNSKTITNENIVTEPSTTTVASNHPPHPNHDNNTNTIANISNVTIALATNQSTANQSTTVPTLQIDQNKTINQKSSEIPPLNNQTSNESYHGNATIIIVAAAALTGIATLSLVMGSKSFRTAIKAKSSNMIHAIKSYLWSTNQQDNYEEDCLYSVNHQEESEAESVTSPINTLDNSKDEKREDSIVSNPDALEYITTEAQSPPTNLQNTQVDSTPSIPNNNLENTQVNAFRSNNLVNHLQI